MNELLKQKQLLHLLKDDEMLFNELLSNSKESIIIIDKNYQISEWNVATEILTEIPKENITGKNFFEVLPQVLPKLEKNSHLKKILGKNIRNVFEKEEPGFLNKLIHLGISNKKNEKKHIRALLITIQQKHDTYLCIISKDITEEKLFQRTVHQNEKHLNILFNNDAIGIAMSRPDGDIYKANNKFIEIAGYSAEELKSLKLIDLIHPHDKQDEIELFEKTKKEKGKKYSLKKRVTRKNGEVLWVRSHVNFQWSAENQLEMIVVFLEDISSQKKAEDALRESERKHRFVAEKASDIIYSVSLDKKITFYNRVAERIFEVPIEELTKHEYSHLMLPKDKEFAKKLHEERLGGKRPPIFRHAFKTPKGKIIHLEFSVNPLFDDHNNVIGSMGIARDITDRVMAEEKLNDKNIQLEELVKTKDKLLSVIAHDLKDPFNVLIGFSDLILEQYDDLSDKDKIRYVQQINSAANSGFNLLNNLLDWSKTQTNKIRYSPQKINLTKTINSVVYTLKNTALAKNLELKFNPSSEMIVYADDNMLRTVLRNIITNAIKFSFKNAEIIISVTENNENYIISVKDSGTGIKKEELELLLNKDNNFTKPGTEYEKGTGLGLIICNELIQQWGGKFNIETAFGKGSIFSFTIPK
ncbi:MAG: PAS domain S-box protein [Bacteroidales bacterium]